MNWRYTLVWSSVKPVEGVVVVVMAGRDVYTNSRLGYHACLTSRVFLYFRWPIQTILVPPLPQELLLQVQP